MTPDYTNYFVQSTDSITGLFWKPRPLSMFVSQRGFTTWNTQNAHQPAGCIKHSRSTSYYMSGVHKRSTRNHRIIHEMMNGPIPPGYWVDHKDGNGLNNDPANLRVCTPSQNNMNRVVSITAEVPYKGVLARNGRFTAQLIYQKKCHWLGTFDTPQEANAAYATKAQEIFGEFARW